MNGNFTNNWYLRKTLSINWGLNDVSNCPHFPVYNVAASAHALGDVSFMWQILHAGKINWVPQFVFGTHHLVGLTCACSRFRVVKLDLDLFWSFSGVFHYILLDKRKTWSKPIINLWKVSELFRYSQQGKTLILNSVLLSMSLRFS
jgi:hypothetical protein